MKKGRFLWSAHRITEKQKAGKARNIKEKRQLKNFNTVSKQLVELRSSASDNFCSQRDNHLGRENAYKTSETLCFWGFSLPSNLYGMSRNLVVICGYVASMQHVCIKTHSIYTVKYCIVKNVGVNPVIFDRVHYMKRLIKYFLFLCTE